MDWLDALRVAAGLSMVGLHATSDPNGQAWPAYDLDQRVFPILLRTVLYFARTELFIIISLFLLIISLENKPISYRKTTLKISKKLIPLYLFWSIFFIFFSLIKASYFGYLENYTEKLSDPIFIARIIFLGEGKYHLHFIPTLFIIVLAFPIFKIAYKRPAFALCAIPLLCSKQYLDEYVWKYLWDHPALPWAVRSIKVTIYCSYGFFAAAMAGIWQNQ
ncbi:MAG: acyltransferase family protein, partial [Pseudomonadota bacterium]